MWRKLQGQSVRGVPALQQFHLCGESRAYRSPGHRCCVHLSEPGSHNLPHTQVSTVGISDYQYDHILLDLIKPAAVTCRKLKAKKQRQQSTPQQYWRVKPRAWSLFWSPALSSLRVTDLTGASTASDWDWSTEAFKGRLPADNSSSFFTGFPNSGQFEGSCTLSAHAVMV